VVRIRLRNRSQTIVRRHGLPRKRRRGVWKYCVKKRGRVGIVFNRRKRALFIAATSRRYKLRGLHPRSRVRTLKRKFHGRRGLRRLRGGIYKVRRGKWKFAIFGTRRGRIRYIGLADRKLLRHPRLLFKYHKRAGFGTRKHRHRHRRRRR
jgi:hypothetical protein